MDELHIQRLNRSNWGKWANNIISVQHEAFPKALWLYKRSLFDWITAQGGYIARLATVEGEFAGFSYGVNEREPEKALGEVPQGCRVMHLCYICLAPKFRGRGYGYQMRMDFIAQSRKAGYHKLSSFAKPGPSLRNVLKSGAKEYEVKPNLFGSGDTYMLCAMDL